MARAAKEFGVPVVAIGGGLADDARGVFRHGIDGLVSAVARDMPLEEALARSQDYVADAAERALRLILVGRAMTSVRKRRNSRAGRRK